MNILESKLMEEIKNLRDEAREKDGPVVSLYLSQSYGTDYKSELNSLIREKRKHLKGFNIPSKTRKISNKLFARLEERVEQLGRPDGRKLFVCFCGQDFWSEYQLPVSLPSKLIVEPELYIRPFMTLLEEFDRYCLVVIDRRKASFSSFYLGKFLSNQVVIDSDVPGQVSEDDTGKGARGSLKVKSGTGREAWGGWRETKIQHHIDDHLHRYLKELSIKLFSWVRINEVDHLVLACPKGEKGEIISEIKPHLHSYVKKMIIGTFAGDSRVNNNELKRRLAEIIADYRVKREKKFLDFLISETKRPDGLGVTGPDPTLKVLRKGQVRALAIKQGGKLAGWICPEDYYLSAEDGHCPVCDSPMKLTEDLLGHMVWEAIDQRAEIRFISTDEVDQFNEAGVGALLRFRE